MRKRKILSLFIEFSSNRLKVSSALPGLRDVPDASAVIQVETVDFYTPKWWHRTSCSKSRLLRHSLSTAVGPKSGIVHTVVVIKQHFLNPLSLMQTILTHNVSGKELKMTLVKRQRRKIRKSCAKCVGPSSGGFPSLILWLFSCACLLTRTANQTDFSHRKVVADSTCWIGQKPMTGKEQFWCCCSHHTNQRHRLSVTVLTSPDLRLSAQCVGAFRVKGLIHAVLCQKQFWWHNNKLGDMWHWDDTRRGAVKTWVSLENHKG